MRASSLLENIVFGLVNNGPTATVLLVILKLTGSISWPWVWVLAPLGFTVLVGIALLILLQAWFVGMPAIRLPRWLRRPSRQQTDPV